MDAIRRQFQYLRSTLGRHTAGRLPGLPGAKPDRTGDGAVLAVAASADASIAAVAAVRERRPLISHPSMVALLIALGAVVGAKFLASTERPQPAAPTILAGPTYKSQPEQQGTTPASQASVAKPAKIRAAQDQTGSITRAVGSTPVATSPAAQTRGVAPARLANNSYFPEPKLVKSVTTDSRGRIIASGEPAAVRPEAMPATQASAVPVAPQLAALPAAAPAPAAPRIASAAPVATAPVPVAKPEKTTVRVDMPPDVDANVTTAIQAAPTPASAAPVVAAAAAPPPAETRKPANVAETAGFGRSTGISVQIAAAQSEEEARAVAGRFEQRFAYELDGRKLSIIQAMPKDKVVYRVRLTEISRSEADTICGQLRANRIGCFVARD